MSSYLKYLIFLIITLNSVSCVSAIESTVNSQHSKELCQQVKGGNLKIIESAEPKLNSFLFDCVVAVSISGINNSSNHSDIKAQRKIEKQQLIKIADFLLTKKIDIQFKNEVGDTLLMTVIYSYLGRKWKEQTVKKLIKLGVNINERNSEGYSAMDFAKSNGNRTIIKFLTQAKKSAKIK